MLHNDIHKYTYNRIEEPTLRYTEKCLKIKRCTTFYPECV